MTSRTYRSWYEWYRLNEEKKKTDEELKLYLFDDDDDEEDDEQRAIFTQNSLIKFIPNAPPILHWFRSDLTLLDNMALLRLERY
jgi:hypothetical protein